MSSSAQRRISAVVREPLNLRQLPRSFAPLRMTGGWSCYAAVAGRNPAVRGAGMNRDRRAALCARPRARMKISNGIRSQMHRSNCWRPPMNQKLGLTLPNNPSSQGRAGVTNFAERRWNQWRQSIGTAAPSEMRGHDGSLRIMLTIHVA